MKSQELWSVVTISRRIATTIAAGGLLAMGGFAWTATAQTDAAVSVYGAFTGTMTANGTVQSPSNAAGGLLELRHISNPLLGYELAYSFNRANQKYSFNNFEQSVKADANQVEANWFLSAPLFNVKVFALAGGGLKFFSANGGQTGVGGQTKPVFIYGAGLDYTVIPHLGVRFQYRGNLYKAPDLASAFSSTHRFAQTAEPMLGAYVRF